MTNQYSTTWFDFFLQPMSAAQTEAEIDFVARYLPQPHYRRVLDLCCGLGRHSRALAARGYEITGVDVSPTALAAARRYPAAGLAYVEGELRDLDALPGRFDGVVNLWQSFGYFDAATNRTVLEAIVRKLADGGRLILDLYHRGFFARHQEDRSFEREGRAVLERKTMRGDRLTVHLYYGLDGGADTFDWQLYTPDELIALAAECGLRCLVACTGFDPRNPPSPDCPRMQLVFELAPGSHNNTD